MGKPIKIAIDGPVGSGKGTLATALAKKINAVYVYTGAMYRELALACLREKANVQDENKVLEILNKVSIRLEQADNGIRAILNGEDVSEEIFQPSTSNLVPIVAAHPGVRREMVLRQRKMAKNAVDIGKNVVMEGRDITTNVIPDADIKIYLTADVKKRAERRFRQFEEKGVKISFDAVLRDLEDRDKKDMERKSSPLKKAPDAIIIDTTNDTIDQTVDKVIKKLAEKTT